MGSSAGLTDYFDDAGSNLTTTKATVPNVPCDGRSLYVQLFTKLDGYWLPAQQYTYTAPTQCAHMLNPPSGSVLGIAQNFSWSTAPGASGYQLNVSLHLSVREYGDHQLFHDIDFLDCEQSAV